MQHSKAVVLCWKLLIKHSLFWLSVIYTDLKHDWLKQSFCKSCAIHVAAFNYKQHQSSSSPLSICSSVLLWATLFNEIKVNFDKELLWGFLDKIPGFQKPSLVPIKNGAVWPGEFKKMSSPTESSWAAAPFAKIRGAGIFGFKHARLSSFK